MKNKKRGFTGLISLAIAVTLIALLVWKMEAFVEESQEERAVIKDGNGSIIEQGFTHILQAEEAKRQLENR